MNGDGIDQERTRERYVQAQVTIKPDAIVVRLAPDGVI